MGTQLLDDKALIASLEAKLEERRTRATELGRQIAALEDAIAKAQLGLGISPSHPVLPLGVQAPTPPLAVVGPAAGADLPEISTRAFRHMRLKAAILRCLELMGRLQGTGAIGKALHAGGFQSDTKDIPKAVSQALVRMWKEGKITRTTENLWGLPKWGAVPNPMPMSGNVAA